MTWTEQLLTGDGRFGNQSEDVEMWRWGQVIPSHQGQDGDSGHSLLSRMGGRRQISEFQLTWTERLSIGDGRFSNQRVDVEVGAGNSQRSYQTLQGFFVWDRYTPMTCLVIRAVKQLTILH